MPRGTKQQNEVGLRVAFMPHRRAQAILKRNFSANLERRFKERKRTKKERKGRPVGSAAPEKISQGRLRQYLLDDFHSCLENPAGFPTATTGPAAVTQTTGLKTN